MNDQIVFEDKSAPNAVGVFPMHIYQSATGDWIFFDGVNKHRFDTEQQARRFAMAMEISEKTIEQELVEVIVGEILPGLRKADRAMAGLQIDWQSNQFQSALESSAVAKTNLAGFPADMWVEWGSAFLYLEKMITAPSDELGGKSLRDILTQRYVAKAE